MKKYGKWALKIVGTLALGAVSTFVVLVMTGLAANPFSRGSSDADEGGGE